MWLCFLGYFHWQSQMMLMDNLKFVFNIMCKCEIYQQITFSAKLLFGCGVEKHHTKSVQIARSLHTYLIMFKHQLLHYIFPELTSNSMKGKENILRGIYTFLFNSRWALIQTFSITMDTTGTPMVLLQDCAKLGLLKNCWPPMDSFSVQNGKLDCSSTVHSIMAIYRSLK